MNQTNEHELLQRVFGFPAFRGKQEEIIQHILAGQDALAIMPTGAGKSLCYQLPALMLPGLTVVISPLIALMKDQVDGLSAQGIQAASFSSAMDWTAKEQVLKAMKSNSLRLLYLSPERLFTSSPAFIEELKNHTISLFAVDEAHCISHWGHDFRADYLQLSRLKSEFPKTPIIAMTATADEQTRDDIQEQLFGKKVACFLTSFDRENIRYSVQARGDLDYQLQSFIETRKEHCGIIYCLSRNETEELSYKLKQWGFQAEAYHAGLEPSVRSQRQEDFKHDKIKIIVATIAFGMGVDKPNVRYVVHTHLPKNIESYYQETGRAGRDGLASEALLLFAPKDASRLRYFIFKGEDQAHQSLMLQKLQDMMNYATGFECRRKVLLAYFQESHSGQCGNCDRCLSREAFVKRSLATEKTESAPKSGVLLEEETKLREKLKAWRLMQAKSESVPAYVVFNDSTLENLIEKKPCAEYALENITGLGKFKIEKYGRSLLSIIRENSQDRILEKLRADLAKGSQSSTARNTLALVKSGLTTEEAAIKSGLTESTIFKHLEFLVFAGELEIEELIQPELVNLIQELMEVEGFAYLSDLKSKLPESVTYRDLSLVRALKLRLEQKAA